MVKHVRLDIRFIKTNIVLMGMKQKHFCAKAGIPESMFSSYMTEKRFPSEKTIEKIASALNVNRSALFLK